MRNRYSTSRAPRLLTVAGLAAVCTLTGCEVDSFLDPSVIGRWERTPTTVPILERIAAIEDDEGEFVEYADPSPEDLKVEASVYRIGPGDVLEVVLFDMIAPRQPDGYQRIVDARGTIDLPQLGTVPVNALTPDEVVEVLKERMLPYVGNPLATVNVVSASQMTIHVMGAVRNPAPYFMPRADYRLLEALTAAGGFSETIPHVFVIRQVPLTQASKGAPPADIPRSRQSDQPSRSSDDLLKIIDDLSSPNNGGSPASFASTTGQPGQTPPAARGQSGDAPPVDLIDSRSVPATPTAPAGTGSTNWMYLDNRWVQVQGAPDATGQVNTEQLVTQRVIRVPVKNLLSGDARYNIVVRAGDIIRVPSPEVGLVYMAGQVARPGVYTLPDVGRLTLIRAVTTAGGLGALAIPERVDLTRMVGADRQATIRLNLRAIAEGTQPDIYLKPDDQVNVGTNFWALPLAVIRGGFRMTYGFGFLLDRNFGNDVFGPPPTDQGRGF